MASDKYGAPLQEERILRAAQEVFARYGYARTTMGDVAQTAGISRPALYLVFPGKEELFSAVIHRMNTEAFQDIHAGFAACGTSCTVARLNAVPLCAGLSSPVS